MLTKEMIEQLKENFESDYTNKIRRRMLNKVALSDLIQDETTNLNQEFNLTIKTHKVTNQKRTNYCWLFAGLNIIREQVIKKCHLDNLELSSSYISFYDKLERFNNVLEKLISYKKEGKKLYDEPIEQILFSRFHDGGNFSHFAHLIDKYGIVPQNIFPETYAASNTNEMNEILGRLSRKFYLDLEKNAIDETTLREEYITKAFHILATSYGIPPQTFDFEYKDQKGNYHIDKKLSPKKFYDKYIKMNLINDYVEIVSYQDEKFKYNHIYELEDCSMIQGVEDNIILNLTPNELQTLIIKQLKSNEPIYCSCNCISNAINGIWTDQIERYGEIFGIDLKLDCNSILKTNGISGSHAMIITGANIVGRKIQKLKLENSWGVKYGNSGYCIATRDFLENYIYRIVINKKNLTEKQCKILRKEKIKVKKEDRKF